VSPVHSTRSHPGQAPLGPAKALRIARAAGVPAIALGGMDAHKFARLEGFHGWAGIDAWLGDEAD
jgi:thiamine-phosphate pyrophosphorylase